MIENQLFDIVIKNNEILINKKYKNNIKFKIFSDTTKDLIEYKSVLHIDKNLFSNKYLKNLIFITANNNLEEIKILNIGKTNVLIFINCEKDSKLNLFEYNKNKSFVNTKHFINCEKDSKLNFNFFSNQKTSSLFENNILMQKKSKAEFNFIYCNGINTKVKNYFYCKSNSNLKINENIIGKDTEKFDILSSITSNEINVKTNLESKIIALNNSICLLKSISTVLENAENNHSNIIHKGIINDNGKIHSMPFMIIKQKNIIATHSSSISILTDDAKFYLASRGIDENQLNKLLINAFIFSNIKQEYGEMYKLIETQLLNIL